MKIVNPQLQEAQKPTSRVNTKKIIASLMIMKLPKTRDTDKIKKEDREK